MNIRRAEEKNDGIHTVTERKLSQSQVNKVLKYGVYAKSEKRLKQAVLKKDYEAQTPSFQVRILITSEASNKVIGTHSKSVIL